MNRNETLVKVVKRTMFGDWVKLRQENTGKLMTVFIPRNN